MPLLSGCVSVEQLGSVTFFTYNLSIQIAVPLLTLGAFLLGIRLRRATGNAALARAWGLLLGSVILGLPASSYVSSASLALTDTGFTERSGLWFSPEPITVGFRNLQRIELAVAYSTSKKSRKSIELRCFDQVGAYRNVEVSLLMREGALVPVLQRAEKHGVLILDRL